MGKSRRHEIVSNLKFVMSELGHKPTRNEYFAHPSRVASKREAVGLFGSYENLLKAAGIKEERPKKITAAEKREKLRSQMGKMYHDIAPYMGKFNTIAGKRVLRGIVASDFHFPFVDKFCLEVFLDTVKRVQPDFIALAGDILDFYPLSKFSKDPKREGTIQSDIDSLKNGLFKRLREICPKAQIDYILGNHEQRMLRYICSEAPGLAYLDALSLPKILELDRYRINLVAAKSMVNPDAKGDAVNFKVYGDAFVVTHGKNLSTCHAVNELKKWSMSGASGHTHHYQSQDQVTMRGSLTWHSLGCMCEKAEYQDEMDRWSRGFGVVHIHDGQAHLEYVKVSNFAAYAGKYYTRRG